MNTAQRVIETARAQIGYHEGRSGGHWNNKEKYAADVPTLAWVNAGGYPWCAVFVCWAFQKAGVLNLIPGGPTAAVAHFRDYAKQAKRFSEYPAVGAIALFGTKGDAHTGIVVSYGPDTITTVEGNTNSSGSPEGDGVYLKTHRRRDNWVYGYAYPTYPEGIDSADPAWQHQKPKPPAPKPPAPHPPVTPTPHVNPPVVVPTPLGKQMTVRVATLNVNQFHSPAAAAADIEAAAKVADILFLQETSKVDVAKVLGPDWTVRQLLKTTARKNIALAWRKTLHGVGGGEIMAAPGSHTTRSRWLDYEDIHIGSRTIRFAAFHRQAFRDAILWRKSDAAIRELAAEAKAKGMDIVVGVDSNAATRKRRQAMEIRTGLHLHNVPAVGRGIDLFLSNLPNSAFGNIHALPKGNSDHRAIVADLTI